MNTYTKASGETIDYFVDWATETTDAGDTINTSVFTVPTGLSSVSTSNTDTGATIILSGGRHGVTYLIENTITTANGLTLIQFFEVTVDDYSD